MITPTQVVRELLDAGVHFGHQTKRWNPKMKPFIFGSRSGIYLIVLEQTVARLERACEFLAGVAARDEQVLFVGTKKQARAIVQDAATRARMPYVINRWMGGTLTNFQTIKSSLDELNALRQQRAEGYFDRLMKKDSTRLSRKLAKLEESFSGIAMMEHVPSCVYVIDPKREQNAVHEANRLKIPVVAICDTNADPDLITYPIPGNDDALRSIRLITTKLTDTMLAARRAAGLPEQPGAAPSDADAEVSEAVLTPQVPAGEVEGQP